jgi:formyl-CoA transferase
VPCAEIQDYGEVFNDAHLRERGFFVDLPHPRLGTVRALGTPLRLRSSPLRLERAGPLLGEHSEEVLREIGRSADEVRALVAGGAVVAA